MGAFKIRGAVNALLNQTKEKQQKGVVTHSSGNFAQALSLAAKRLHIPAYMLMPTSAPGIKKEAVETYDGKITVCDPTLAHREKTAIKIGKETAATFVHPSNDLDVIYGNATAGLELLQDQERMKIVAEPSIAFALATGFTGKRKISA